MLDPEKSDPCVLADMLPPPSTPADSSPDANEADEADEAPPPAAPGEASLVLGERWPGGRVDFVWFAARAQGPHGAYVLANLVNPP